MTDSTVPGEAGPAEAGRGAGDPPGARGGRAGTCPAGSGALGAASLALLLLLRDLHRQDLLTGIRARAHADLHRGLLGPGLPLPAFLGPPRGGRWRRARGLGLRRWRCGLLRGLRGTRRWRCGLLRGGRARLSCSVLRALGLKSGKRTSENSWRVLEHLPVPLLGPQGGGQQSAQGCNPMDGKWGVGAASGLFGRNKVYYGEV